MKTTTKFALIMLLPVMVLLSGCPIGLDYPAGEVGTEKIDTKLLGTWTTDKESPDFGKVTFTKASANSYTVKVEEQGEMYGLETDEFTSWITKIGGKTFIYSKPSDAENYYLYCYKLDGKKLYTYDVGLLDGGVDKVKSTESLRQQIETSLKKDNCLTEETIWVKE